MKSRLLLFIKCALGMGLLVMLVFSAERVKLSCADALKICASLIVPSLFPFFVLSAFLTRLGLPGVLGRVIAPLACRIYGISPAGASAIIMGFLGGYPTGAAYIAQMEKSKSISRAEGERLMAFCNNSGPAFIVGVLGTGIFGSVKTGLVLYAVHIFSALFTGLFFRGSCYSMKVPAHRLVETDTAGAIVDSVKQAVSSILNVCGFVLCFSVLLGLMDEAGIFPLITGPLSTALRLEKAQIHAAVSGLLELGSAAGSMQGFTPEPINLALAAGILGWGGLSVHFQSIALLSGSNIKGTLHLAGRLLSALTAALTMYILSCF